MISAMVDDVIGKALCDNLVDVLPETNAGRFSNFSESLPYLSSSLEAQSTTFSIQYDANTNW